MYESWNQQQVPTYHELLSYEQSSTVTMVMEYVMMLLLPTSDEQETLSLVEPSYGQEHHLLHDRQDHLPSPELSMETVVTKQPTM